MRLAACNELLRHLSWPDACRLIADAGFEGVEIAPFVFADSVCDLGMSDRVEIRSAAESAGLQIVGLHWLLVSPAGMHVAHADVEVRSRTADYLRELTIFAADLGADRMVFGSPKQRSSDRNDRLELMIDTLTPAVREAEERQIVICIEPLPLDETNFINTMDEAAEVVRAFNSDSVSSILDVKSALSETEDVPSLIANYQSIIRHVHLNDSNRRAPGFGATDFGPILSALKRIGYTGWLSIEPFDDFPDPESMVRGSGAYLRKLLADNRE